MCFFIPKKFQGNPPAPNDQDVFILENPEMSVFVKTFMGYGSDVTDAVWIKEKESLMREMQDMGVENRVSNNHFYTATYDIGLSKHEVMLEIITREKKSNYDDDNYAIDDQTGLVTSPNWGKGNYPVNLDKVYPIKVAAGSIIEILFTDFMLEGRHSSSCIFDWVKVVDGDGTELLGKTCGTNKPAAAIKSNTNEARIEFHSDLSIDDKGFRAEWKACTGGSCNSAGSGEVKSPGSERCADHQGRGKFKFQCQFPFKYESKWYNSCTKDYHHTEWCSTKTDASNIHIEGEWGNCASASGVSGGSIKSPDFPNNYPNNEDQEWDLSAPVCAPDGSKIQLTFNSFDLEDDASCSYDYVQISYGTFSKKYCGASKPDPVTSTGNTMKVKFHSDNSVVKKGFSAVWKTEDYVQGILLTGSGGEPGDRRRSVEVLTADGTSLCSLPDLPYETSGHTQHGLTTCGGSRGEIRRLCYTFDASSGTWNVSNNLSEDRISHNQWWDSFARGLWLLGGSVKNKGVKSSELLYEQSSDSSPLNFELKYTTRYACEIELNDKFVLTGGTDNDGTYGNPLTRVTSYDVYENVVVDLPELLEARMTHGCTYFSNNDNNQVFLVAGGFSSNPNRFLDSTEMFIEGQTAWTKVNSLTLPSQRRGPFMITLNNNVFLTGGEKTNDILKMNKDSLTWTEVGRMKEKRGWHKGSIIDLTEDLMDHCTTTIS